MEWRPDLGRLRSPEGISEAYRSPFTFGALGVLWRGVGEGLQLRTRADGGAWGEWRDVEAEEDAPARSGEQATGLMTVDLAREAQLRLESGPSTAFETLRVVLLDTAAGPSPPAVLTAAQVDAPRIVSQAEWGADPALLDWPPERVPVRKFSIHHTATSDGGANPAAAIRAIYRYHADTLGWGDIGYNYLIDRTGTIYEGRAGGPNVIGAHSGLHSAGVDGIALLGTFQDVRPSEAMLTALARLIAWRSRAQHIDPRGSSYLVDRTLPNVFGHRDVTNTSCPGDLGYSVLPQVRQQAATLLGAPTPRAAVTILGARVSPASISVGDTVQVEVTVRNGGSEPLGTQGPPPGTTYRASDTFMATGNPGQTGQLRVGVEADGERTVDHRYRWGLGSDLGPGEVRTVTGAIRFEQPGTQRLWVGVVQEGVGWLQDNVGQAAVTVYPAGASSYAAASSPASQLYFPLVMRDNPAPGAWSTRLALANTAERAATGTISFLDGEGRALATAPIALGSRASTQLDVSTVAALRAPYAGAAVIRADHPLVGVAIHERPAFDRMAVEAFTRGATRLYVPLAARSYHGLSTGIQVQNLGSAPTTATVTYVADQGATWGQATSIAPLASATFYAPALRTLPEGFVGSAIVDSMDEQPLAAVVNESRTDGVAMSYPALAAGSATATAPLLYRNRNGWASGLQVQNLGGTTASVVATYLQTNGGRGPWEQRGLVGHAIAAGFYLPAHPQLPDDLVASALVRAPEGQPLLTLAQSVNAGKRVGTAVSAVPVAGATLYVPLVSNQVEGWRSGVQLQNGASQPASVTLRFLDPLGMTVLEVDDVIPSSGAKTYYLPAMLGLPVGFAGSLVIQGRPDAILSAVVNDIR